MLRARAGARFRPDPVHPGPDAGRHPRLQPVQLPDQPVHPDPRARSSASCCSPTRSTAPRPRPRRPCSRRCRSARVTIDGETHRLADALHGGRDPESDRAAGRLSAARGAARPLPVQASDGLSLGRGGEEDRRRPRRPLRRAAARGLGDRAEGRRRRGSPRRSPRSRRCRWSTRSTDYVVALVRATREAPDLEGGASPARGGDAGRRGAGAGGARRARLCHPRRRQGAGAGGAAPPRASSRPPPRSRAGRSRA